MSNHELLFSNNSDFQNLILEEQEEFERQALIKQHIDLYYNNNFIKPKKKKTVKGKRSYSKKPGVRGKLYSYPITSKLLRYFLSLYTRLISSFSLRLVL